MSDSIQVNIKDRQSATSIVALRWWPALLMVLVMAGVRYLPNLVESPGMSIFMIAYFGPAALSVLILVWWLAASRATWRERIIGFIAVIIFGFVANGLLDKSLLGMGFILFVVPSGCAAFAVPLILLANRPQWRLAVALVTSLLGFGAWDLVQSLGVSGKFASSFDLRWNKTPEQEYLASLAKKPSNALQEPTEIAAPITLASAQWPSFRGPNRDGKLNGVSLANDWTSNPPKRIWLTKIGPGWSSFAVAGNRLFTQEQRGEKEAVVCLNADTGAAVWVYEYTSRFWESLAGAGPRATPTIADEGLFSMGGDGILSCLNAGTGKEIWHRNLQSDAARKPPMWGFSSSPLVVDGLVIVHAGGDKDKGLLAYDAKTGEPRWSVASGNHSYSSPQSATFDGVAGILMETNAGLQFCQINDGSTIWQYDWPVENYRTLQPLVIGNSVLIASSLGAGTRRITATRQGTEWTIKEDWTSKKMKSDFNDFVEHQGYLYGFDGSIFGCIDLENGSFKWKKGRFGNGQVLLLCDAGQMLVTSEAGELVLLKTDADKMVEMGKIQAIQGKTWNHSVMVGNRVYLRNGEEVACYELPLANPQPKESH